jgi:hypothetical protein
MSWDTPLARPLKPKDHAELRTLDDARRFMLKLPDDVAAWNAWQHATKLLLEAAKSGSKSAIDEATDQIALALFTTYQQDMSKL